MLHVRTVAPFENPDHSIVVRMPADFPDRRRRRSLFRVLQHVDGDIHCDVQHIVGVPFEILDVCFTVEAGVHFVMQNVGAESTNSRVHDLFRERVMANTSGKREQCNGGFQFEIQYVEAIRNAAALRFGHFFGDFSELQVGAKRPRQLINGKSFFRMHSQCGGTFLFFFDQPFRQFIAQVCRSHGSGNGGREFFFAIDFFEVGAVASHSDVCVDSVQLQCTCLARIDIRFLLFNLLIDAITA